MRLEMEPGFLSKILSRDSSFCSFSYFSQAFEIWDEVCFNLQEGCMARGHSVWCTSLSTHFTAWRSELGAHIHSWKSSASLSKIRISQGKCCATNCVFLMSVLWVVFWVVGRGQHTSVSIVVSNHFPNFNVFIIASTLWDMGLEVRFLKHKVLGQVLKRLQKHKHLICI